MVNVNDGVPRVPGVFVNENVPALENLLEPLPWTYSHVGELLQLNDKDSMHLNQEKASVWNWHNLEVYLHLVDGYGRYRDIQNSAIFTLTYDYYVNLVCIIYIKIKEKVKGKEYKT